MGLNVRFKFDGKSLLVLSDGCIIVITCEAADATVASKIKLQPHNNRANPGSGLRRREIRVNCDGFLGGFNSGRCRDVVN